MSNPSRIQVKKSGIKAEKKTVVLRADASVSAGTGHVMRCLALAHALKRDGKDVCFAVSECPDAILKKIRADSFSIIRLKSKAGSIKDAEEVAKFAKEKKSFWVVSDGYQFSGKYQDAVRGAGLHLLFIDDYGHCKKYCADIILNQNLYAGAHFYPKSDIFTRFLLGTQYALLRPEFFEYRHWKRKLPEKAAKILITLGGSDPDNTTLKILKAVKGLDFDVKAVVGSVNPHLRSVEREIKKSPNRQILKNVPNMPDLMAWADVVITGGGSTCWETCFMGLPNIIIYCGDNQKPIALSLDSAGAAINLGHNKDLEEKKIVSVLKRLANNREARKIMSEKSRLLIDGMGAERVVFAMNAPLLRKAGKDDCRFVWELSNSREVRAASFSQNPITWETHREWYDRMMKDRNCFFLIAETPEGVKAGQVRFRINGKDVTISTSLAPEFRGRGYGNMLIAQGSESFFQNSNVNTIHAYIKPENKGSVKSFVGAGYCQVALDNFAIRNNSLHLVMKRGDGR
jgi:UDP-2,4-diacetamido-2,4,6-trideoxy-beta-L-altropyranose hydrolase